MKYIFWTSEKNKIGCKYLLCGTFGPPEKQALEVSNSEKEFVSEDFFLDFIGFHSRVPKCLAFQRELVLWCCFVTAVFVKKKKKKMLEFCNL